MRRNTKRKEVTKQAVLAELESLRQGRHARYRTLVGRFARCRDLQSTPHYSPAPSTPALAHRTARHSLPRPAGFRRSVDGTRNRPLLPRLAGVPLIHRVVADDRLAVMLAKSLVELDIAVPGDWKRAECDPTSSPGSLLSDGLRHMGAQPSAAGSCLLRHQRQSLRMGRA